MRFLYDDGKYIVTECTECGMTLKFKKYQLNDIHQGVECFCGNISDKIEELPKEDIDLKANSVQTSPVYIQPTGIHCPTCGSRNVKKISLTSKAVGAATVGILSSNIRKTFKCNSCGYKW